MKPLLSQEESETLAETILKSFVSKSIIQKEIERMAIALQEGLKKIMEDRMKPKDPYPYKVSEDKLREIFEKQHHGRALERSHRGTYRSPPIAALWNQHLKTAREVEKIITSILQE